MTADVTEQQSPEDLATNFRTRYQKLIDENKQLAGKIKDNETTALKLLGAIETLDYLYPHTPEGKAEVEAEPQTEE